MRIRDTHALPHTASAVVSDSTRVSGDVTRPSCPSLDLHPPTRMMRQHGCDENAYNTRERDPD